MKKVFLLFLIFFYLSAGAYEFKHSLLPEKLPPKKIETIEYAPYTVPEFGAEMLGFFISSVYVGAYFMICANAAVDMRDFPYPLYLLPATGALGVYITGNNFFEKHGSFLATVAGSYLFSIPFASLAILAAEEMNNENLGFSFLYIGTVMVPFGTILGYVSSQKERQFDSSSLLMNVGGTIAGGIVGMSALAGIKNRELRKNDHIYALSTLGITLLGTVISLSVSRNIIADEPDNAGTWGGVLGGALIGAAVLYLPTLPSRNNYDDPYDDYDDDDSFTILPSNVAVVIGAVLGAVAGYAITHTTVPGRRTDKENKVLMTLLPPAMIPERVPFINKQFTSWSLLNFSVKF